MPHSRILPVLLLFGLTVIAPRVASTEDEVDSEQFFRRMNHFIVNNRPIRFELSENPQPFVDWGFIRPGFVEYVHRETGEIIPLNDRHAHRDSEVVRAVPFGVASGVRIRVQPARKGKTFRELISPTYPWESEAEPYTMIHDQSAGLYRLWYRTAGGLAYAESQDTVHWQKPQKEIKPYGEHVRTNLIGPVNAEEALAGVMKEGDEVLLGLGGAFFVDPSAPSEERYKVTFMAHTKTPHYNDAGKPTVDRPVSAMTGAGSTVVFGAVSADGIAWRIIPRPLAYHDADTLTVTKYDALQKKYVVYTRLYELSRRSIGYIETTDFREWPLPYNILTPGPEHPPSIDFYSTSFSFYPGQPQIRLIFCLQYDRATDSSEIRLASSRDGRCFHFTPGPAIIARAESGQEGHGFLTALPGLVRAPNGRMMLLYRGYKLPHKFPRFHFRSLPEGKAEDYVAWWPEDRLVALEADEDGQFTTADFVLRGDRMMLNMSAHRTGGVHVELRDEDFKPVQGRTFADSDRLSGDHLEIPVTWRGESDLSAFTDRTIYLRFRLRAAKLFAIKAGS